MPRPVGLILLEELKGRVLRDVILAVSEGLKVEVTILGKADLRAGFDIGRGQWRADLVAKSCIGRFSSSQRFCVALTGVDLYTPSLNFVFGLALKEEGLAVVSWHRLLDGDSLLVSRLSKEVIHEVGHLEGLDHCPNGSCVMWFSNTLGETDAKGTDFCPECARKRGDLALNQ